jgi:hypothetical protein
VNDPAEASAAVRGRGLLFPQDHPLQQISLFRNHHSFALQYLRKLAWVKPVGLVILVFQHGPAALGFHAFRLSVTGGFLALVLALRPATTFYPRRPLWTARALYRMRLLTLSGSREG